MAFRPNLTSPLMQAVRAGALLGVVHALDAGADVNEPDVHGHPGLPLRTACFSGNVAVASALIARGAKLDVGADDGPYAALRLALRAKQYAIVALLLEHGATVPPNVEIDRSLLPLNDNLIEFTPSDMMTASQIQRGFLFESVPGGPIEETEPSSLTASTGTETNFLTMDLLHFMENGDEANLPMRASQIDIDLGAAEPSDTPPPKAG